MLISDTKPFIRHARYLNIKENSEYPEYYPCDARLFFGYMGQSRIKTENKVYELNKNSLLMINSDIKYRILNSESTLIAVNFDYTRNHSDRIIPVFPMTADEYRKNHIIEKCTFDDFPELDSVLYINDLSSVCEKLERLMREFTLKRIYHELKTGALMCEIITEIIRNHKSVSSERTMYLSDRIINYIHENHKYAITNISLGDMFGFHPNYISSLIKQQTGLPLHRYLMKIRISHAIDLLDEGTDSINTIAEKCGFCDIYYFSAYFKKVMGVSPAEYRKR